MKTLKDCVIYYFGLHSPTPCAFKIADKISEQFDNAVLLMVGPVLSKYFDAKTQTD